MNKIDINSNLIIYFIISWIVGLVLLILLALDRGDETVYIVIFINFLNILFNGLVIIFLLFMYFTFTENRTQFLHSIILLLINFPFLIFYCLIILLITDNF